MEERRPGALTGVIGTMAAVAGAVVVVADYFRDGGGRAIAVGGILVVAGLLLRIESAIRATSAPGDEEP